VSTIATKTLFPWLDAVSNGSGKATLRPNAVTAPTPVFKNTEPLARTSDPATSKSAAATYTASGQRGTDKSRLLGWLKANGAKNGMTSHEIASHGVFAHPTVHKRLPDLRRDGLVVNGPARTCTVTGRSSLTWKAA